MYDNEIFRPLPEGYGTEILRAEVGSTLHGVVGPTGDDRDEMGVFIPAPQYVTGLNKLEQYSYRSKPEGVRSDVGDLDLVVYTLRKWMSLAVGGNPSILNLLFATGDKLITDSSLAQELRDNSDLFRTQRCAKRYLGYMKSQREKLLGLKGGAPKRPELVEKFGFDTKFAYHMVRLGIQGIQFLVTGTIELPMLPPHRERLTDLRSGKVPLDDALSIAEDLEATLYTLAAPNGVLPPTVNTVWVNQWLHEAHLEVWSSGVN